MRARYLLLLILTLFAGCLRVSSEKEGAISERTLIQEFSNCDIEWDGDYIGLIPNIEGKPSLELVNHSDDQTIQYLILSLKEKDRFVAAHVLLTRMTGINYERNHHMWNGLHVDLNPSGKSSYITEDMDYLYESWQEWLSCGKPNSGLIFKNSYGTIQ